MKKKALLVTSGSLDKTGVPSVIMTVARGLCPEWEFDILLSGREGGYFEPEFLRLGGRILRYRKKRFRLGPLNTLADFFRPLSLFWHTRRAIRRYGPYDAVHCHNEFDMAGSLAAARAMKVPARVGHVHKDWSLRGGPVTMLYRALCRRAILSCATARLGCSRQACGAFYGPGKGETVYNPYDETRFVPGKAGDRPPHILQVGYFCDNKNQLFTLDVFARLAARLPEARLTLVGAAEGEYGGKVLRAIEDRGLMDRVTLLPPDADVPALMRECGLLLFPSRAEGFGMVLIEAQASGLHCVSSDSVPRETDLGGVTYLPLSLGAQAWAEAILADGLWQRARPRSAEAFSTGRFIQSIHRAYGGS